VTGDLSSSEQDHLDQLGLLTKAGDIAIRLLLNQTDQRLAERKGAFVDVHDFVARMRKDFPQADSFGRYAEQLLGELRALGMTTPEEVRRQLYPQEGAVEKTSSPLVFRFGRYLGSIAAPIDVDHGSSDHMLVLFLDKFHAEVLERHPRGRGEGRPSRLVQLALRWRDMIQAETSSSSPTAPMVHE
jgi:hypothetical protein